MSEPNPNDESVKQKIKEVSQVELQELDKIEAMTKENLIVPEATDDLEALRNGLDEPHKSLYFAQKSLDALDSIGKKDMDDLIKLLDTHETLSDKNEKLREEGKLLKDMNEDLKGNNGPEEAQVNKKEENHQDKVETDNMQLLEKKEGKKEEKKEKEET